MRRGGMGRWIWIAIGLAVLGGGLHGTVDAHGGEHLVFWLMLADLGIGIVFWALLSDDGDGLHSMLRTVAWLCLATLLVSGALSDVGPACYVLAAALVVWALHE